MKKILFFAVVSVLFCLASNIVTAQTNVSGGIYTNTTWTLAGSPYIVTDTVVVFPGVTLTIQPGVVVKFDSNIRLEIRQATLIAQGTQTDSISFTSNTLHPSNNSWSAIYLNLASSLPSKFNYCNFKDGYMAIYDNQGSSDTVFIQNSMFRNNYWGLFGNYHIVMMDSTNFYNNSFGAGGLSGGSVVNTGKYFYNLQGLVTEGNPGSYCFVNNCIFEYNTDRALAFLEYTKVDNCVVKHSLGGISDNGTGNTIQNTIIDSNNVGYYFPAGDSIEKCQILYNGIGIEDTSYGGGNVIQMNTIDNNRYGMVLSNSTDIISCNSICNNSVYDMYYYGTGNVNAENNYWCTPDSAATRGVIYDGYHNINYGLVVITPIDTSACYPLSVNVVSVYTDIKVYPNPVSSQLTISLNGHFDGDLLLTNVLGQEVSHKKVTLETGNTYILDVSGLSQGTYLLKLVSSGQLYEQKVLKF